MEGARFSALSVSRIREPILGLMPRFPRTYATVLQPPAGSVFLSIPLDDWDQAALGEAVVRTISTRFSPDPNRVAHFAERVRKSKNPVLLYGPEIERGRMGSRDQVCRAPESASLSVTAFR